VQSERHLLIDGHNVLHAWEDSRTLMKRSPESARLQVISAGILIHDIEHISVSVVFDGKGDEVGVERPGCDAECAVLYAPDSMTADDLIEQIVGSSDRPQQFVVATGDRMERETVAALGAECVSPTYLKEWVDRCRNRQSADVKKRSRYHDQDWRNSLPL
jgi:predicted RNA-binding protein with PIN domain